MTNKKMFKKICDVDCTLEEILEFSDDRGRGTPDYFKAYYNLDSILKCLNLYYDGKISSKHLSEWAFAYSMILLWHQSFRTYRMPEDKYTFKALLETLFLSILGYIDEYDFETQWGENEKSLRRYEKILTALDKAYTNIDDWSALYRYETYINEDDEEEEIEEIILLCIDNKTKEFFTVKDAENYYEEDEIALIRLSPDAFEGKINELSGSGYTNILPWDEIDFEDCYE